MTTSLDTQAIIDGAFLRVCPPAEAVEWLKRTRERVQDQSFLSRTENDHQEQILYQRNDAYIEFGLARYGVNEGVATEIYLKSDLGIRCTILAYFPNGGFARFYDHFALGGVVPTETPELCALFSNPTLNDNVFEKLLSGKPPFGSMSEEQFEAVLIALSKNPRMSTPYDESFLDGYSEYTYNNVFTAAWQLAATVPVTPRWASVLHLLLTNCQPPISVDPRPMIQRWYLETEHSDGIDPGYYLRSRLADLLAADKGLLAARDPALRSSFYRRFGPSDFPKWFKFGESDREHFLDSALHNTNLWRSEEIRETLSQLCWNHPDPSSDLMMVNQFRAVEGRMRQQHPEWFNR
jgi:hypothetical protein